MLTDTSTKGGRRRSLREATALEKARWLALLQSAPDAIVGIDREGRITIFNPSAERIFGYTAEEILGRDVDLLMPSPYRDQHRAYVERYLATGEAQAIGRVREVEGLRKSGERFPLELSVSEARVEGGRDFLAIIRDVSERRRLEHALREEQARFRAFMQHLPGCAFMKDGHDRYVWVNETFERLFGRPASEIDGHTDAELFPQPAAEVMQAHDARVRETGKPLQETVSLPHRDGPHDWLVTRFPIFDAPGGAAMIGGVALDVTESRRNEKRLRELEQAGQQRERLADIGAITAQIAHDLGNPLAALSMQAQLIVRRARRDEQQPVGTILRTAEQIVTRVRDLDTMIREFLDFARGQQLQVDRFDLCGFLQPIAELWDPLSDDRGIEVRLLLPEDPVVVEGDREKLYRVFENLIKNAAEAIETGPGEIVIGIDRSDEECIRIIVADSGPGIPAGVDVFRLFETSKPHGTGLGLPIVRQIVQAHGGTIDHEPRDPAGTRFIVDLPRPRRA